MAINKTVAGTFAVDFRDQWDKRHQKTFDKHSEAVKYEKDMLALVANGEYVAPKKTTLREVAMSGTRKKHPKNIAAQRFSHGKTTSIISSCHRWAI